MRKLYIVFSLFIASIAQAQSNLSLKQLSDSLLANNYSIRLVRVDEVIAKEQNGTGASGSLPTVGLTAGQSNAFNNTRQEFFNGQINQANNAANQARNASVRVDWTLFNGFRVQAIKDQLQAQERLASLTTISTIEEQLYELASNYFELVSRSKMLESLQASVKVSSDNYQLALSRQKLGRASKQEVLQSLTLVHSDSTNLLLEENRIRFLKYEIKKLTGLDAELELEIDSFRMDESSLAPLPDLISNSLTQNLDIKKQKSMMLMALGNLKQQKSELYPKLGLFGEYNFVQSSNQIGILKSNTSLGPSMGLSLSYNLFDGFRVRRNINIAKWESERQNLSIEKTEYELRFSIMQAYQDYLTRKQLVSFEKENVKIADQNLALAQAQLTNGAISNYEFREVQQEVLAAKSREIDAEYQLNLTILKLQTLSGTLLRSVF